MIERTQPTTNSDFLSDYDKSVISELAEEISNYYFSEGLVYPEKIATENGITYSHGNYSTDSFDGLIECLDKSFHIYINNDRLVHAHTVRARFTFAHELGHYFIDHHRNALMQGLSPSHSSKTGFVSKNFAEREADYFASCLLLPESRFKADCFRRKFSFELIDELSKKYQSSFTATALRFTSIGNHPIMVVLSFKGAVKWYWSSQDFPYKYLLHNKTKVPDDTVAGEYFSKQRSPSSRQDVFAMDWFKNVWESSTERKFHEQCKFNNNYALSIIWED